MSYSKMRVEIPDNPVERLDLASDIYKKHTADGTTSPLNAIATDNWSVEGPKIALCIAKHDEAEESKRKMEALYKERDLLLAGIDNAIRSSRDVLAGVHHDNMKRLADWGFTVVESPKPGPKSKAKETKS